jgi:peptide/nickel transport system permease protein
MPAKPQAATGGLSRGDQSVERILAGFLVAAEVAPTWLVDAETGLSLTIDRLYPELGLAIWYRDARVPSRHEERLRALCRQAGISLVVVQPEEPPTHQALVQLHAALSAAARRVAQQRGARQVKLDLLPRIASAKALCRRLMEASPAPGPRVSPRPGLLQWLQRRLRANWRRFRTDWQVFAQNRLAVVGLVLILLFGLMSVAFPILRTTVYQHMRYDPITGYDTELIHPAPPSRLHLLGTDTLGRDVLSMLLAATTPTFIVGISAALTTAIVGTLIGMVSAYRGGVIDTLFTHISDAFLLLPAPIFMVIVGMRFRDIGPVPLGVIYGVIAGAGGAAIVMRAQALQVVVKPFIDAARIAGGGGRRVMLAHVLPHMLPLAALYMMLAVTGAVVADAFIAFFGFTRAYLNWGTIIYLSFAYASYLRGGVEWHVMIPPSIALSLFAAAFYFVSRGLHEVADPRLRAR